MIKRALLALLVVTTVGHDSNATTPAEVQQLELIGPKTCKQFENKFYECRVPEQTLKVMSTVPYTIPMMTSVHIEQSGNCRAEYPHQLTFSVQGEEPQTMVYNMYKYLDGEAFILHKDNFAPMSELTVYDSSQYIYSSLFDKSCRINAKITFNMIHPEESIRELERLTVQSKKLIELKTAYTLLHDEYLKQLTGKDSQICITHQMMTQVKQTAEALLEKEFLYQDWAETSLNSYLIADVILTEAACRGLFSATDPWGDYINQVASLDLACSSTALTDLTPKEEDFSNAPSDIKQLGIQNVKRYQANMEEFARVKDKAIYIIDALNVSPKDYPWAYLNN